MWEPRKPAAPVTRIRLDFRSCFMSCRPDKRQILLLTEALRLGLDKPEPRRGQESHDIVLTRRTPIQFEWCGLHFERNAADILQAFARRTNHRQVGALSVDLA